MDYAIIGMACRFPQTNNLEEFWKLLLNKESGLQNIPKNRWVNHEYKPKVGGFIDDIDCFDPLLFGISYKEAEIIDPQQRKMLEVTYEAIEDALIDIKDTNPGVFIGAGFTDHGTLTLHNSQNVSSEIISGMPV